MILYPAGPQWARCFETDVAPADMAQRLANGHGFHAAAAAEPFGRGRGSLIATREHMLVLAVEPRADAHWYSVAPTLELQNLLWSWANGYASQWSELERRILTGRVGWPDILDLARQQFAAAVRSVERALTGMPESEAAPAPDDAMWMEREPLMALPVDYLVPISGAEVVECAH